MTRREALRPVVEVDADDLLPRADHSDSPWSKGTLTEGSMSAARAWLWPFVSALRSLCSQRESCGASRSSMCC